MKKTETTDDEPTITAKGAAQMLGLADRTITQLARQGRLACTRDSSGRRLYRPSEIRRYQKERDARMANWT